METRPSYKKMFIVDKGLINLIMNVLHTWLNLFDTVIMLCVLLMNAYTVMMLLQALLIAPYPVIKLCVVYSWKATL